MKIYKVTHSVLTKEDYFVMANDEDEVKEMIKERERIVKEAKFKFTIDKHPEEVSGGWNDYNWKEQPAWEPYLK